MSFLIIGNELDALVLEAFIRDHGWPTTILSKHGFDYKSDCELVNPNDFKKLGFDYKRGFLTNVESMEVIDLFGNKTEHKTDTVLINLAVYKNELFKKIKKSCKIYENTTFIDKSNENVFVQQGEHGTLIKSKYVFDVNDLDLAATTSFPTTKSSIRATVERQGEKGKLTLKFLDSGYYWIVNYSNRLAELCIVADNPEKELSNLIKTDNVKVIYKKNVVIPFFKKDRILSNKGVYLSGSSALVTNNLNFYNLLLHLEFVELSGTFAHELMTKKNISYSYLIKDFDAKLRKYDKQGKVFWSLDNIKRNKLINKMDFSKFALNFGSAFDNLSVFSSYKLKMLFK